MAASPRPGQTGAEAQNERPREGFKQLYQHIAVYPELGRFRRFGAEWAKLLHDDTDAVLRSERDVFDALKIARRSDTGVSVLDCPRWVVEKHHKEIYNREWKTYEECLRKHGETLCLSQRVMALPVQADYATKYLTTNFSKPPHFYKPPGAGGQAIFGLTGEPDLVYFGPQHGSDTCAWRALPHEDFFTKLFLRMSPWVEEHIFKRVRRLWTSQDRSRGNQGLPSAIPHHSVVAVMDTLMCLFASLLFTAVMFALAGIGPLRARIGAVGGFGAVFSLTVWLMAGTHSRRIEIFAATAAFFAVASVFVSNTGGGCGGI